MRYRKNNFPQNYAPTHNAIIVQNYLYETFNN